MIHRKITRVFIANRGEIAVRIVRACQKLGLETVVAVSAADRDSMAARMATRSVCIGPPSVAESYLCADILVTAARATGCEAVHPGYGFLSERADFARLCVQSGLVFIGPSPEAIEQMGDKVSALKIANEAGVPLVPGSGGRIETAEEVRSVAARIGYPVLLKASAGGGGRGMRVIRAEHEIEDAMRTAILEAEVAFGDGSVYVEKNISRARHIEIQVLADVFGNTVHLGERDCSVQRRHQKLIEESPSPVADAALRDRLGAAAVALAKRVDYLGAGTVEFILDQDTSEFYFLEMNTRIQVEHPVSEMVTGVDLVAEQIRIAAGQPLSVTQDDLRMSGHAIECRINAEDVGNDFTPSPGRITMWEPPSGQGIRLDTHCHQGAMISPYYDSMIAKLIVHGPDRPSAIDAMIGALSAFRIQGVHTTLQISQAILSDPAFRDKGVTTRWLEKDFLSGGT